MSRTSKMSGQRGADQHQAKGFDTGAHRSTFAGSHVGHEALPLSDLDWDELQDLYPSLIPDGSIGAIPRPAWRELDSGAAPRGTSRGIARYEARLIDALLTDSDVEKLGLAAPEIEELLGGTHVPGHTEGENLVMSDMARASKRVIALAEEGPQQLGLDLSDEIQVFMGAHLVIFTLANRGNQRERCSGPQVVLGPGRRFVSLDARLIPTAFEQG